MSTPVFRFAPSPNGRLHLGHAYSALLNERLARQTGGRLLLRIEDTDPARSKPEFVTGIIEDLAWLGIVFETPMRRQSEHMNDYRAALSKLDAMGLIYRCSCTRSQLAATNANPADPDGQPFYPQTCRAHGAKPGVPFALRLKMDEAMARLSRPLKMPGSVERTPDPSLWGDVILARKDTGTSYHLSVVVDDHLQGVTHVVRGADMAASTSIHLLLQELFGMPHPAYRHHDLIMHDARRKLSKSHGDQSLLQLRSQGASAADIRLMLGFA